MPMIWNFQKTLETKMSFNKGAYIAVVFILQTDAKSVKYQKGGSLERRELLLDMPLPLK